MATELDNLPDEELTKNDPRFSPETIHWLDEMERESMGAAKQFVRDNNIQEWIFLEAYLNSDSRGFNNPKEAARIAWPALSPLSHHAKGRLMALKHQDRIKAWLDEEGYTPEKIKLHTARWFTMKEPKYQKVSGAVDPSKLPSNARVLTETGRIYEDKGEGSADRYGTGETIIEIQMESPHQLKALELASKHQGMLKERVELPELTGLLSDIYRAIIDKSSGIPKPPGAEQDGTDD
jgi:hypothetical protein